MRKITRQAVEALIAKRTFTSGNTVVSINQFNGTAKMYLHGNLIATHLNGVFLITDAGWATATTKERLNGLPGVSIRQKRGQWYLNGKPWDGIEAFIDYDPLEI